MNMKKGVKLCLIGLFGSMVLSGCGSSNQNGQEIELFSSKPENNEILQELVSEFEKENDGVKIKITSSPDAVTALKTRLTKNDIPDLLLTGGDVTFAELKEAGVLENLTDKSYVNDVQDAYNEMVTNLYDDEDLYGVPYAANASGIIYNKDIFEKAGIEVPETWDELMAATEKFKSDGIQPFELTFKDTWTMNAIWNSLAPSLEPTNFISDRKAEKTTFSDDYTEITEKYLKILEYAQPDFMGTTYGDGNVAFAEGKAAMMINGNWAIPEIKKTNPDINVGLFPFPSSNDIDKNYVTSGIDVMISVGADSEKKEDIDKFIEFVLEKENAEKYINDQFAFSAVKDVEQNDPSLDGVKQEIEAGKIVDFPDHYYPGGFDLASSLSELALNKTNDMDDQKNTKEFLGKIDKNFDVANVD